MKIKLSDLERLSHFNLKNSAQKYQYRGYEDGAHVYFKIPYKGKYPKILKSFKDKEVDLIDNKLASKETSVKKAVVYHDKIVKTKKKPPFYKNPLKMARSTSFPIRNESGVYIVYIKNKIVYVGSGKDVYISMYRHFYPYNDSDIQKRTYFKKLDGLKVSVIYTKTQAIARKLEAALIIKYKPKNNTNTFDDFELDTSDKKLLVDLYEQPLVDIQQYKGEDLPF